MVELKFEQDYNKLLKERNIIKQQCPMCDTKDSWIIHNKSEKDASPLKEILKAHIECKHCGYIATFNMKTLYGIS